MPGCQPSSETKLTPLTNPALLDVLDYRTRYREDFLDLDSLETLEVLSVSGVSEIPALADLKTYGDLEDICCCMTQ
jgi:hypothetical protein